jgi:hypothetical protein
MRAQSRECLTIFLQVLEFIEAFNIQRLLPLHSPMSKKRSPYISLFKWQRLQRL